MDKVQILEIPCGSGGLNSLDTIGKYPIEDLRLAENLTYEDDTWRKEGGSSKINTVVITGTPAPSITGLWDFWSDSSTQVRIAGTSDGRIISFDIDGIENTLVDSLTSDKMWVFVEAYGASYTRKLFCFNGADPVRVTTLGVTSSIIATPPADWTGSNQPVAGVVHNGRLWGFGNLNQPNRVYYSSLDVHEEFSGGTSGTINVYPGEGQKLIGAYSFAGRLYLFKYPRGIYWIDDSSTTTTEWRCRRLTNAVGLASPLALAQTENDVFFMSSEGLIYSLAAVQDYGEAASVKTAAILPEKIGNYLRANMALNRIANVVATYYDYKKEWHLAYAQTGYAYNNRRLVIDVKDTQNLRIRVSNIGVCESMALSRDSNYINRPMVGDNVGFIRWLDNSTRNKDGAAYTGKFETGDIELAKGENRRVNLQYVEAIYKPLGDHNLTLDIYADGVKTQSVDVYMGISGGVLGTFILGTDILAGGNVKSARKRIVGDCRRIRLVGYNSGLNQDFSISNILVGYTLGNERV